MYILIDIVRIDCVFGWKSVQTLERDNMLWAVNLSLSIKIWRGKYYIYSYYVYGRPITP